MEPTIAKNTQLRDTFYDEALEVKDDDSIDTQEDGVIDRKSNDGKKANFQSPKVLSEPTKAHLDEDGPSPNEAEQIQNLPPELVSLFSCIDKYEPREIEIKTELKCFIPSYIPAIGDVDPFLKVPRPDGKPDGLGLYVIDEPALVQSDPAVLELQLRAKMKKRKGDVVVRSIDNASKNPYEIEKWIQSIEDLHRSRPAPEVMYKFPMPEMEEIASPFPMELVQALDNEFADALDPQLDLSLEDYAKLICAMLDVPVREKNLIQNLHFLFNLSIELEGTQSDTISAL